MADVSRLLDRTPVRLGVAALSIVLLLSIGGAFVVALLLIPVYWAMAHRNRCPQWEAIIWAVFAVLAVTESAWAAVYLTLGETLPWIWLLPLMAGILTAVVWAATSRKDLVQP